MIFHFKSKSFSFNMVLFLGPKETTERQGSRGSESSSRTDWRGRISYRSNISTNWQVILIFFLQLMRSQLGCKRAYSLCINFFFSTLRLFGGLVADIKRKIPWYASDFKDCLHIQCVASTLYLYLATLTPNVTFGGLLGLATNQYMVCKSHFSFKLKFLPFNPEKKI